MLPLHGLSGTERREMNREQMSGGDGWRRGNKEGKENRGWKVDKGKEGDGKEG